jgi:1,4-dihydroxy-2-naphthoyl-CoA synthase
VIERRPSGSIPGKGYPGSLDQPAEGMTQITTNRPEVRNALRSVHLFELPSAFNVPATL